MVLIKSGENKWLRRYRFFFVIGILILIFQLYLAFRFLGLGEENIVNSGRWSPHKMNNFEITDVENNVNSARKSKDSYIIDDEDMNVVHQHRLNTQSKSIAITNSSVKSQSVLRLQELDFVPSCKISTKEAVSAIHRAKTQMCKQLISNITCLIAQEKLYPKSLPNYCPSEGFVSGKSLGCFKDEKNYRLLNGYYGNYKNLNSPDYCIHLCLQSGFLYAGVQYSTECFCGNDEPKAAARLPDSSCNMKCPANPHLACGGYFTINIYQTGIAKFVPQTAMSTTARNTKSVKIVFLLTLNGRALRQVRRLIKILYHQNHYFYIHVDARQDYLFRELLPLEKQFPNIRLTRQRFSTIWGGASLLQMLLNSMRELLQCNWNWDFVINLSESDYPVKTLDKLVMFLSANRDKNFVKSHGREMQRFIQKQGLDKTFVECDTHMWRIGDRLLPWGIQIDGGSDWIGLSRNFVAYAANENPDPLVQGLLILFNYTLLPAESFFHTVLKNSKFCKTYIDNNLHITNWKRKLGCKCQYKHIVDWCGCSPNDFRVDDWLRIQNTENRPIFFARKFEPIVNQAVILQLEQWLYNVNVDIKITNLKAYWQSVYHHLDLTPSVDDSLLTMAHSIARLQSKIISKRCQRKIITDKILEVTSYHLDDNYNATLILYLANITHVTEKLVLETSIKIKNTFILTKSSSLLNRLKYIKISTDYDQKEQTLRNFAQIMGPYSEPSLVIELNSDINSSAKTTNITFLWIDPVGRLIEVSELSIDDTYIIGYVKPVLKQPLLPGSWTVKLIYHYRAIAEIKFLIVPLEFFSGHSVTQKQVAFIHSGSYVNREFETHWDQFLPNSFDQQLLLSKSIADSKRYSSDLQEWIDSLVNKFFTIKETCIMKPIREFNCSLPFNVCKKTNWSSVAPDPKSNLETINKFTGRFDIWQLR